MCHEPYLQMKKLRLGVITLRNMCHEPYLQMKKLRLGEAK